MATTKIRQRFSTPIEETFKAVSNHHMLANHLPLLKIKVVETSASGDHGLNSVRAIGGPLIQPLKEKVTVFDRPNRIEYKVVGLMRQAIAHHHGIIEFTSDGSGTLVDWHIDMTAKPAFVSRLVLGVIAQGIRRAMALEAKQLKKN